jgi:hypothetical protein
MDSIDKEEIEQAYDELMDAFDHFQRLVQQHDKRLYLKWKSGGCIVEDSIFTTFGTAKDVYDELMSVPVDEEVEEDYDTIEVENVD